jgi:hypothetical protein
MFVLLRFGARNLGSHPHTPFVHRDEEEEKKKYNMTH